MCKRFYQILGEYIKVCPVYVPGLLYVKSEDKGTLAPDWKDQIVKVIPREGPKEYYQSVVLDFYRGSLISGNTELSHEYCF